MKKIWFLFIASAALLLSCKKNFDANRYATPSNDALPEFLLYTGLNETATNNATNYLWLTRWMGYWASPYAPDEVETYDIKNNFTDAEWANMYHNLKEYDELEKTATDLRSPFFVGAAKLMKAYCFSTLVDLYNDIPYYNVFNETTNGRVYDHAQDIYNDLVLQLDSSFQYFEDARDYYKNHSLETQLADDQYDIMFGSAKTRISGYSERLTLWEKLVNTLELKLLIHQSQIPSQQSFITEKINALNGSKERKLAGFIGPGQSATVNPGYGSSGKINPFYGLFWNADGSNTVNASYYTANTYASDFYKKGQDARWGEFYASNESDFFSPYFGSPGDTSLFWGFGNNNDTIFVYYFPHDSLIVVLNGDTLHRTDFGPNYDGDPNAHSSFFSYGLSLGNGLIKGPEQDQFIFSDFESLFLQAEAVQSGYLDGNAETLYESAIRQNFIYLFEGPYDPTGDGGSAAADVYFAQVIPDIGWSASPDKLEAILTQKWAAMNGIDRVEAYNDYRRTGYPTSNVLGISHALTHVQPMIPIRLLYPQSELDNNAVNVPQLGTGAQFTAKVFWDQ